MKKLLFLLFSSVAAAQVTISPSSGTYSGPITVTVNCPSGQDCFYTTDGSKPSIAGFLYSTPLTINASATVRVIAAQTGVKIRSSNTSASGWECATVNKQDFGITGCSSASTCCKVGGGIGSIQPSAVSWTWGTPMVESMTTTNNTGSTQMLFIQNRDSSACPNCTEIVQDKITQPDHDKTALENNEMDLNNNQNPQNTFHTASLQCNQQAGTLAWQVDNQQGSWVTVDGATFGCPLSTTQQTEIRYGMHWDNSDTSCTVTITNPSPPPATLVKNVPCDHYDFLTVCVGGSQGQGGTCHDYTNLQHSGSAIILAADWHKGWGTQMAQQDQPDTVKTAAPVTVVRRVWNNNGTLAYYGTETTASATYTIGAPPTASPYRVGGSNMQIGGSHLVIH